MRKQYYLITTLFVMLLFPFTGNAQISGPSTVSVGQSITWTLNNAPVNNSYTWSPGSVVQPGSGLSATSLTGAKLGSNTAMSVADYPSVWYDSVSGRWFAFTISRGITPTAAAALYRLDLGTDPTPSNINAANTVTTFDLTSLGLPGRSGGGTGEVVHAVVYNQPARTWHLFWIRSGHSAPASSTAFRIRRLDFGNSLSNTPTSADAVEIDVSDFTDPQQSQPGVNAQIAQSKFARADNGDYILFVGSRWGAPIRVNFGQNITNLTPKLDRLSETVTHGTGIGALIGRSSAIDVVKQNGNWFLFCSTTDASGTVGNELWRINFGTDLSSVPATVEGLGSLPNQGHWGLQIVPSACGDEYYGFINARGNIYRLDFGNDLTSVPVSELIGTANQNGLSPQGDNSGFFAYVYGDSLYAIYGMAGQNGLTSVRLPYNTSNRDLATNQAGNNSYTHTYTTLGSHTLTATVNLNGGGAAIYCHTVNVVPARPDQPGPYTAAPTPVCRGQQSVTYTVPAVTNAASYRWHYTGSNVSYTASTTQPTNSLSFQANASGGTLRVWSVSNSGDSSSIPRDTAIVVNVLPNVAITPATASVCAGGSVTLTGTGATTYSWSHSGGNTATAIFTPAATTTYTVTGTSLGCSVTATRQVVFHLLPVTQITLTGGITDICTGDSILLTASGSGYSYEWKDGTGIAGTGSSYAVYATGSYKVVATDINSGCSDSTQAVDIHVYDPPVVSLDQNDTSFCIGGVATLEIETQDTGLTYVWKQDDVSISQATAHFLEVSEGGVYKVIVGRSGVGSCEDSTNEVTVVVYDLPVVDITWDNQQLHATPGYVSYQWNTGNQGIAGATDSTYTPASNGGYSVTVTDGNGCENTSAIQNLTNVSVSVMTFDGVSVYPNPSGGMIYIGAPVRVDVLLLGMDGRLLQRVEDASQVDLSGYTDGLYLLRITNAEGVVLRNERVVKQ